MLFLAQTELCTTCWYDAFNLSNFKFMEIRYRLNAGGGMSIGFEAVKAPYRTDVLPEGMAVKRLDDYFPEKNPIVFIFALENHYGTLKPIGFFDFLKKTYPGCKLILTLGNPVDYYRSTFGMFANRASTAEILSTFDMVCTYNEPDAREFGLRHYDGPYCGLPVIANNEMTSDVFFIGLAKKRLDKIIRTYEMLKGCGLVCDFYIATDGADIPSEFQKYPQEIHYNRYLPYTEVLEHVARSRGVLEVAQEGTFGITVRYFESLVYDKNFITDNQFFNQERFASSPKIFFIDEWKNPKVDREKYLAAAQFSHNYRNEYSALNYLSFLEYELNRH